MYPVRVLRIAVSEVFANGVEKRDDQTRVEMAIVRYAELCHFVMPMPVVSQVFFQCLTLRFELHDHTL